MPLKVQHDLPSVVGWELYQLEVHIDKKIAVN